MPALAIQLALTLIRQLSALPDYPRLPEGEAWAADRLCEFSVSVDHARAIVAAFEDRFPTIRELRETAESILHATHPATDPVERWKAEGATYDPNWSEKFLATVKAGSAEEIDAVRKRSIRDALWYTEHPRGRAELDAMHGKAQRSADKKFWADAKRHHEREHAAELGEIRAEMQEPGAWDEYLEAA